jgi:putative endonuclease
VDRGDDRRPGLGRKAEALAVARLEEMGMTIVQRNWRRPEGELDVVATDGAVCVFVEVRSRTGEDRGHALETVTPRKRAQIIRTARLYLSEEKPAAPSYRFDVVGVTFWSDDRPPTLAYVRDAFDVTRA